MGIPRPQGVIRRRHPDRSGVPLEAGLMDELTVAKFLKYDAERVAVVEIPGGTCEVYRSECGYMVHLDRGAQLHRLIPCASRARLFEAIRQNLGSGPFAELSWKLVGKVLTLPTIPCSEGEPGIVEHRKEQETYPDSGPPSTP